MNNIVIITSYLDAPMDIKAEITKDDYVICTDGGYDVASRCGVVPDMLLGDFDSIQTANPDSPAALPQSIEIKRFPPEKDYTDLHLALEAAFELGASKVRIFGGIGGRLDHTVANLQLLSHYSDSFDKLTISDGKNQCFVLNKKQKNNIVLPAEENCYLSLFSLSEQCSGVTIRGVKYPLENHTLTRNFPLGVSNEFTEKAAVLSVDDGDLLVVISRE